MADIFMEYSKDDIDQKFLDLATPENISNINEQLASVTQIVVNVKSFYQTGQSDYSQAVKDAIASLPNGGEIQFSPGTFTVNNVSIPSNIRIKGSGKDSTKIQRNVDNSVFIINGTALGSTNGGTPSHWNNGFEDLTVTSSGTFASDLVSIQGTTAMNLNRIKFDAYGCRLLFLNQVWDSRFKDIQFYNGGKSDGTPSLELAGGLNGYMQTKECVFDGIHFEGYTGPAIRTIRDNATNFKTQLISFSNIKFESKNCTGNHLNLNANDLQFSNVYITSEFTTTDVIMMTGCRGVMGNICFCLVQGNTGDAIPSSFINLDSSCYLVYLNVEVWEPQPSNANVITQATLTETTIFINITAAYPLINNTLTQMGKVGTGTIWFDSQSRPRISGGRPSNINTSGYGIVRQLYGGTSNRPTGLTTTDAGYYFFDQTVNKPIWWNGSGWKDATGTTV